MEELNKQIMSSIALLENITTLFYQQKDKEGYDNLLTSIDEITNIINKLDKIEAEEGNIYSEELLNVLKEAISALEERDTVQLADILQYELIGQLKEILSKL